MIPAVVMIAGVFAIVATIASAPPLESPRGTPRLVGFLELALVIAASPAVRR
ncbi:MAG TPA: hypothetical protein VNL18_06955 [Gemmatimonadales bacterium]|nr:hypothetical protein [Gemmatimonadales bacterium]